MKKMVSLKKALEISADPKSTAKELSTLVNKYYPVDCLIAKHPNCPDKYYRGQFDFLPYALRSTGLCQALASRKNISRELLQTLALEDDYLTKKRVLTHPCTSEKTKEQIAKNFKAESDQLIEDRKKLFVVRREILIQVKMFRRKWPQYEALATEIEAFANYHPVGWTPIYEPVTTIGNAHRKGNLVFAHFYTSEKHPWPQLDGIPLAPLLQLDIKSVRSKSKQSGQLASLPEIDGLLQVWTTYHKQMTIREGVTRFIPAEDVYSDIMTNETPTLTDVNGYLGLAYSGLGGGRGLGAKIVGWRKTAPKYISYPSFEHEPDLECFGCLDKYEQLLAAGDQDAQAFSEAEVLVQNIRDLVDPVASHGGTRLFGVSSEFQGANAWERRPRQTLFQFDGDGDYEFRISGFGTAIVYWQGSEFDFSWSSYG